MIFTRITSLRMMSIDAMTTLRVDASPTPSRAAARREAEIAGHDRDQKAEHDGLQRRGDDVRVADVGEGALEVQLPGHAGHRGLGDVAADDAGEVHHDREQRHRDHQRDDARDRQVLERVDRGGFERVDLLAHLHRADLGADAGADAPGHEEPRDQRSRLADERDRQAGGNHRLGAEALERGARVHRQHDADREARREDQRRGAVPELNRCRRISRGS